MKSAFLLLAGGLAGALVMWFIFSKEVIMVPHGTTLVEVNRFSGKAREVFYSFEEANRLEREEDARDRKAAAEWEKAHQSSDSAVPETTSADVGEEAPGLSAEDLALVKFTARITTDRNPSGLEYSIYNGTGKTLVLAQARIEGVNKETGLPLARNVQVPLTLGPSTDASGGVPIQNGHIDATKVEGLKITLVKVLAR